MEAETQPKKEEEQKCINKWKRWTQSVIDGQTQWRGNGTRQKKESQLKKTSFLPHTLFQITYFRCYPHTVPTKKGTLSLKKHSLLKITYNLESNLGILVLFPFFASFISLGMPCSLFYVDFVSSHQSEEFFLLLPPTSLFSAAAEGYTEKVLAYYSD